MWPKSRSDRESAPTRQAREGAQQAEEELVAIRRQRHLVDSLASFISDRIRANHFGESIELAIERRKASP